MKNLLMTNDFLNKVMLLFCMIITVSAKSNITFPRHYNDFMKTDFCDACGCSSNGGSLGIGGVLDNNFVGLRYIYQVYEGKNGIFENSPKVDEYFQTLQLWSKIVLYKNIEFQIFAPYHRHSSVSDDSNKMIYGVGDITLMPNYLILDKKSGTYNKRSNTYITQNHIVRIGIGLKLPTGTFNQKFNGTVNPSFQLGTGSLDYVTSLLYTYKYNNFGLNNYINYSVKTTNENEYKFGNQLNTNNTIFFVYKTNDMNILIPSISIMSELKDENKHFKLPILNSEGYAIYWSFGMEYNTKKLTFGFSTMHPMSQNLNDNTVKIKFKSNLYINYNILTRKNDKMTK